MATRMRLRKHQIDDLKAICDLGSEGLRSVADQLTDLTPPPMSPDSLFDAVVVMIPNQKSVAEALIRQVLSLHSLIRQGGLSEEDVVEGITDAVSNEWTEALLAKWKDLVPELRNFLSLRAVRLVATAIDLSYEYANLLSGARIITDIRPIFSDDAGKIEGAVVSHTLRLRFDNVEGDHELSIAMDKSDIEKLARQCERALRKAHTAHDLMVNTATVPTIISGSSEHA